MASGCQLDLLLTSSVIDIRSGSRPGHFTLGTTPSPRYPLGRRPGGRQGWSERRGGDIRLALPAVGSQVLGRAASSSVTCQPMPAFLPSREKLENRGHRFAFGRCVNTSLTRGRRDLVYINFFSKETETVSQIRSIYFVHHSYVFQPPRRSHYRAVHRIIKRKLQFSVQPYDGCVEAADMFKISIVYLTVSISIQYEHIGYAIPWNYSVNCTGCT